MNGVDPPLGTATTGPKRSWNRSGCCSYWHTRHGKPGWMAQYPRGRSRPAGQRLLRVWIDLLRLYILPRYFSLALSDSPNRHFGNRSCHSHSIHFSVYNLIFFVFDCIFFYLCQRFIAVISIDCNCLFFRVEMIGCWKLFTGRRQPPTTLQDFKRLTSSTKDLSTLTWRHWSTVRIVDRICRLRRK